MWKMFAQREQPDFYKFGLDLPMTAEPGGNHMVYFTAGINLLGGIVRNTTGMPVADFFEQYLAIPLNMRSYHLNLTPTGEMYGGGGLYLRPRDALKLGQLYLNGGTWNRRRNQNRLDSFHIREKLKALRIDGRQPLPYRTMEGLPVTQKA